jgi:hypothetical protein
VNDLKFLASVLFVIIFCVAPLVYLAGNLDEKRPAGKENKGDL